MGKLTKDAENADKYKRLYDKGYLVQENSGEYVNITEAQKKALNTVMVCDALPM